MSRDASSQTNTSRSTAADATTQTTTDPSPSSSPHQSSAHYHHRHHHRRRLPVRGRPELMHRRAFSDEGGGGVLPESHYTSSSSYHRKELSLSSSFPDVVSISSHCSETGGVSSDLSTRSSWTSQGGGNHRRGAVAGPSWQKWHVVLGQFLFGMLKYAAKGALLCLLYAFGLAFTALEAILTLWYEDPHVIQARTVVCTACRRIALIFVDAAIYLCSLTSRGSRHDDRETTKSRTKKKKISPQQEPPETSYAYDDLPPSSSFPAPKGILLVRNSPPSSARTAVGWRAHHHPVEAQPAASYSRSAGNKKSPKQEDKKKKQTTIQQQRRFVPRFLSRKSKQQQTK